MNGRIFLNPNPAFREANGQKALFVGVVYSDTAPCDVVADFAPLPTYIVEYDRAKLSSFPGIASGRLVESYLLMMADLSDRVITELEFESILLEQQTLDQIRNSRPDEDLNPLGLDQEDDVEEEEK